MKKFVSVLALALLASLTTGAAPALGDESNGATDLAQRSGAVLDVGDYHTCAIVADGSVKCWGEVGSGQLGTGQGFEDIGDDPNEMGADLVPVDLGTGRHAVAISAGYYHTCAILDTGDVKCWGNNSHGQLGLGHPDDTGDDPNEMGDNLDPVDLGTGRTAVQIAAGHQHTCALLDTGDVKCWGDPARGKLGDGQSVENIGDDPNEMGDNLDPIDLGTGRTAVSISSFYDHVCALLDNGDVKCWGRADGGTLGDGQDTDQIGDEPNEMGDDLDPVDLGTGRTAVAVTAGYWSSCAILDNGDLKCWGRGEYTGSGQSVNHIGDEPNEMGDDLDPVDLGTDRHAVAVSGSEGGFCAVLDNGDLKCWGDAGSGQLGDGQSADDIGDEPNEMGDNLDPVDLGTGRTALAVSTGEAFACALLDDHTVKCWGSGSGGELGNEAEGRVGDDPGEMGDDLPAIDLDGRVRPIQVECPTSPHHGFPDVTGASYADVHVTCMKELAITTGTNGGTLYSPADYVTREQMAAFIARVWRSLDQTCASSPAHGFPDVTAASFADDDVTCIKELGITTGTHGGALYSPADYVTREQMAAFLGRLWEALGNTCPDAPAHGFPDVTAASFADRFVTCIKNLGITTGTNGGTLYSPADYVTREQMAAFIGRLIAANADVTNH